MTMHGFKVYNRKFKFINKFILTEVRLLPHLIEKEGMFTLFDRNKIASDQIKSVLNMVPLDITKEF